MSMEFYLKKKKTFLVPFFTIIGVVAPLENYLILTGGQDGHLDTLNSKIRPIFHTLDTQPVGGALGA